MWRECSKRLVYNIAPSTCILKQMLIIRVDPLTRTPLGVYFGLLWSFPKTVPQLSTGWLWYCSSALSMFIQLNCNSRHNQLTGVALLLEEQPYFSNPGQFHLQWIGIGRTTWTIMHKGAQPFTAATMPPTSYKLQIFWLYWVRDCFPDHIPSSGVSVWLPMRSEKCTVAMKDFGIKPL